MSQSVQLVVDARAVNAEGPIWHARNQLLYWVSIQEHEVHVYDPATNEDRAIDVGQQVGTVVPRESGGVIVALHHGIASLDLETGNLNIIADPEANLPAVAIVVVGLLKLGVNVDVRPISLNKQQVLDWNLPPAPVKSGDTRSASWDGLGQVELDAVEPTKLKRLCTEAIESVFDFDLFYSGFGYGHFQYFLYIICGHCRK